MNPFQPDESNRRHPFVAPEGYFDELPARIQKRVSTTAQPSVPRGSFRWIYFAAAGFVAMFAVSVWLVTRPTIPATNSAVTPSAEQLLAEVPTETLVDYLLLAEVDVMNAEALSEAEQAELLEEFDTSDSANELLFDDTNDENN